MNPPTQSTATKHSVRTLMGRSRWWRSLLLISLIVGSLALSPATSAVSPPPDGGYPNANIAQGEDALFSLGIGFNNLAIGYHALYQNTTGYQNTASGFTALPATPSITTTPSRG